MINVNGKTIHLACGSTDMRKSINGLSAIVQSSFKLNPCSADLFVFCNRKRDRLKILEWDKDGFWLHLKRLEDGHFKWPSTAADEPTMAITREELTHILNGPGLEQKLRRKYFKPHLVV